MSQGQGCALDAEQVMAGLDTEIVGRQVQFYPSVGSTNVIAKTMAAKEAGEGLVILTDEQTAGRGRRGRQWTAPAGTSILMSILLRPGLSADKLNLLTMIVSLAAVDGIQAVTERQAMLKWPNDILIGGMKVGGVLTEGSVIGSWLEYAVVGLGLNVNFDPSEIPQVPPTASSLMVILGEPVDRLVLVQAILDAADRRYRALKAGQSPFDEWSQHLSTIGQHVQITLAPETVEGVVEGVDKRGALRLRTDDGALIEVAAGDVVMLRSRAD